MVLRSFGTLEEDCLHDKNCGLKMLGFGEEHESSEACVTSKIEENFVADRRGSSIWMRSLAFSLISNKFNLAGHHLYLTKAKIETSEADLECFLIY